MAETAFKLACPICGQALVVESSDTQRCPQDGNRYQCQAGLWRCLPPDRLLYYQKFVEDYLVVRRAEGWGFNNSEAYRSLPRVSEDHPQRAIWQIRQQHFNQLLKIIEGSAPLKILDIGAGNGWLSNQLSMRGHTLGALDLLDDDVDGLGAKGNYSSAFDAYQGEFDRLPFESDQFDVVVFNAALHYSIDLAQTLCEAKRVTKPAGRIVVLDSPFYTEESQGEKMIAEREAQFARQYRFVRQVNSIGFLTPAMVTLAAQEAGLIIRQTHTLEKLGQRLRRRWAQLRMKREAARFPVIVVERSQ